MVFVFLPTGPISAFLVHQTSTRVVVVMGAVLLSLSSLLSAFAPQAEFLFFSYSLLTGRLCDYYNTTFIKCVCYNALYKLIYVRK